MSQYRIGIDVGGTFTDIVGLSEEGRLIRKKVPSSPEDFSLAVLKGLSLLLDEVGSPGSDVQEVIHGTTVATNAIIEKKGARTGLITTSGFRDILEIGRLRTPRLYDLTFRKPEPLVPRELRREALERVMSDGTVLQPLDEKSVKQATELLKGKGITSIAICFINSFANPDHEIQTADLIHALAPDISLSISHQVLPEMREYERTSTTVVNAYVRPVVDGYLGALETGLEKRGIKSPLMIMQSNGGIMRSELARQQPVYIVESGPAAGVMGAVHLSQRLGHHDIISFDMGGTTAKAATIRGGEVGRHSEYEVGGGLHLGHHLLRGGGYVIRVPSIELAEVGAGGGSIIWIDQGGVLQVGPQSAGAHPGPACYNTGGTEPTITDANVVLGYLDQNHLVGGELSLNSKAAFEALDRKIGSHLGLDATQAAYGAYLVACSRMIRAVKAVSSAKGQDPRRYVLYAFGGGGPLHAIEMASQLGIQTVVIPPAPGLFSSLGLLFSDVEHHYVKTLWRDVPQNLDCDEVNAILQNLYKEGSNTLAKEGFPENRIQFLPLADLRYQGQKYEMPVPLPNLHLMPQDVGLLEESFHIEHEKAFNYRTQEQVQLVNIRLIARGIPEVPRMPSVIVAPAIKLNDAFRRAYFGPSHGWIETPVITRAQLNQIALSGPVIIEEYDATTVVPPTASVFGDAAGNIVINLNPKES